VANGVYYEYLYIDKTINLIGSSMDSTVIDGTGLLPTGGIIYFFENNSRIENFRIIGTTSSNSSIISTRRANVVGKNCKISNSYDGLSINFSSASFSNFFIENTRGAVRIDDPADTSHPSITNSIIISTNEIEFTSLLIFFGSSPIIENNIIVSEGGNVLTGIEADAFVNPTIKNNFVIGFKGQNIGTHNTTDTTILINNITSYSSQGRGIKLNNGNKSKLRNNILSNNNEGIYIGLGQSANSDYNLFWMNSSDLFGINYGDSDIVADPMFIKDTIPNSELDFDYHLQAYSPAIDAGDPEILDVDGTRSDMGIFGGPKGEYYKYLDLPPRTPRNFRDSLDLINRILFLNWDGNSESDFSNYNIYRDTIVGFIPNEFNLISQTDTSYFTDDLSSIISKNIYYRIAAIDSQDNESQPGNEIAVLIVGVNPEVEIIRDYILYQNYPNPFNPSTKISYEIKDHSYVKLMVYDIKGELISVLVNKEQDAGYYEVEFNAEVRSEKQEVKGIASGIYLYRIEVIGKGNLPVYSDMKKMILIK
jgi:hypothetical protein